MSHFLRAAEEASLISTCDVVAAASIGFSGFYVAETPTCRTGDSAAEISFGRTVGAVEVSSTCGAGGHSKHI